MANVEGESPNFDELKTPGEEAAAEGPVLEGEAAPEGETIEQLQPVETLDAAAVEMAEAEQAEEAEEIEKEEPEKGPGKTPLYLELAGAIGVPLLLLALFWLQIMYFSTAIYLIGAAFIPYSLWKGRRTNTIFTVFLGCTLFAVLTAAYCLWMELGRYRFDLKAKDARVSMVRPVERALFAQSDGPASDRA